MTPAPTSIAWFTANPDLEASLPYQPGGSTICIPKSVNVLDLGWIVNVSCENRSKPADDGVPL